MERSDPGDMGITQLQALYEHLTGRVATGAWGKDESGLRLKIAEAHRKHLLLLCVTSWRSAGYHRHWTNSIGKCDEWNLALEKTKGLFLNSKGQLHKPRRSSKL